MDRRRYLIDGYNLVRSGDSPIEYDRRRSLEATRDRLIDWLVASMPTPENVTVVFDASADPPTGYPSMVRSRGVLSVFASGYPNADELILEYCLVDRDPGTLVVVSDDREIRAGAKRRKATPLGCREFVVELAARARTSAQESDYRANRPGEGGEKPDLSTLGAERDYWLSVFGREFQNAIRPTGGDGIDRSSGDDRKSKSPRERLPSDSNVKSSLTEPASDVRIIELDPFMRRFIEEMKREIE